MRRGVFAATRLANRPALAATAAGVMAAAGVYASLEPGLVIALAIGTVIFSIVASSWNHPGTTRKLSRRLGAYQSAADPNPKEVRLSQAKGILPRGREETRKLYSNPRTLRLLHRRHAPPRSGSRGPEGLAAAHQHVRG